MYDSASTQRVVKICAVICILVLMQSACSIGAPEPTATPNPTATLAPTATNTPTPIPTATATATATPPPTATATPTPTATPNRTATAEAKAAAALAAALKVVNPVLEKYKINGGTGLTYFANEPVQFGVDQYNTYVYNWIDDNAYSDFVYHSDITWESTGGLAGCGVTFRSDGDIENGEFYRFDIMRLQNAPAWQAWYVYSSAWKNLGWKYHNSIKDTLGSQNTITIIAKGSNLQAYVNDVKMTEIDYNKLSSGRIAELVWQESGKTNCMFSNSWVWALK